MFGFKTKKEEIKFRLVTNHKKIAIYDIPTVLSSWGIKVFDIREADIVNTADKSVIEKVYLFDCICQKENYRLFKKENRYDEMIHEGLRTLVSFEKRA